MKSATSSAPGSKEQLRWLLACSPDQLKFTSHYDILSYIELAPLLLSLNLFAFLIFPRYNSAGYIQTEIQGQFSQSKDPLQQGKDQGAVIMANIKMTGVWCVKPLKQSLQKERADQDCGFWVLFPPLPRPVFFIDMTLSTTQQSPILTHWK